MTNTWLKALLIGLSLAMMACSQGTTAAGASSLSSLSATDITTTTGTTTASTTATDTFGTNTGLYAGQSYTDSAGYTIAYGYDGNLVIYNSSNTAVWQTGTSGYCSYNCYMLFQGDGNLVLYSAYKAYFSTKTAASQLTNQVATQLVFPSTAPYLAIENASGTVLWSSN